MKQRFNTIMMGINMGILAPIIGVIIYYYLQFASMVSFDEYLIVIRKPDILPKVISFSLLANLATFFICLWLHMYETARGVIAATIFYGVIIVGLILFG